MGYESKLIVGHRDHFNKYDQTSIRDFCEVIMTLDLSCMCDARFSNQNHELFDKEIDFDLFKDDGNTLYNKDDYGNVCYYTSLDNVIKYLEKTTKEKGYYRRADLALKALKAFKKRDWNWKSPTGYGELVVVHYGY